MPNHVVIEKQASKFLERLRDAKLRRRFEETIHELEQNAYPANARKLQGFAHLYRIRIGDYRMVYQTAKYPVIIISIIEHRSEVYRLMQRLFSLF